MIELIAQIILISSIIGILFIFFRKMPVLINLPEIERVKFIKSIPEYVFSKMKDFKKESLKKAKPEFKKEKNVIFSDDYWEKIRKG